MNYKNTIEKADDFNPFLMTINGYPVYDIMIPNRPGYVSASGIAFYTEDEDMLKEFSKLNLKEKKEYVLNHIEHVKKVEDIFRESPEMKHPLSLAYKNLIHSFKDTVKKGNYGCAYLIDGDKLLIFNQREISLEKGFYIEEDLSLNDASKKIEDMLLKPYKEGKISPVGKIIGKAFKRLKAKNPDVFKEMSKYQSTILGILKSFRNELLEECELSYDKMEDKEELIIEIKVNNTMYIVNIPKKEEKLYLTMDKNTQEFKNIKELIIGLYKEITSQKLDSFIKKTKNKM